MTQSEEFFKKIANSIQKEWLSFFKQNEHALRCAWDDFGPKKWAPIVLDDGNIQFVINKHKMAISLVSLLKHLLWLYRLRACKNVTSLKNGFHNPEQFSNTLFEVRCAYFLFSKNTVANFEFSPEVLINGKSKWPEFKFMCETQEVYCECKSLLSLKRAFQSKISKLFQAVENDLKKIIVPSDFRVELIVESIPSNFNRNLGEQLKAAIETIIKQRFLEQVIIDMPDVNGKLILHLKPNNAVLPNQVDIFLGINPRNSSNSIDAKNFEIIFCARDRSLDSSIRSAIKDAYSQLPQDKPVIIFLETFNREQCIDAAREKVIGKEYPNLACVILSDQENKLTIISNPRYELLVSKITNSACAYTD